MGRAVAYVRDIVLGQAGDVLTRTNQAEVIRRYAAEGGIDIVAWFEDGTCTEEILKRQGIQALLAFRGPYSLVICERALVLSRSLSALKPFLKELDRRGAEFEPAATTWDCVSQQYRRLLRSLPVLPPEARFLEAEEPVRYRVTKPARLNFVRLVHHRPASIS